MARSGWVRVVLVLAALPPAACECGGGDELGTADGALIVSPAEIDFGEIAAGAAETRVVSVTNAGASDVTVTRIAIAGDAAFTVSALYPPLVIPGRTAQSIEVHFSPTAASGRKSARLEIVADDRDATRLVEIRGAASNPAICVTPSYVSFDPADGPRDAQVKVAACGSSAVVVTAIDFTASSADLTLAGAPALPFTLAARESRTMTVHYAPSAGAAGAVLTVRSSGTPPSANVVITAVPAGVPSSAGRWVYYWRVGLTADGQRSDIMRLPLQGGQPEVFWGQSTGNGCPGCHQVSPDGRFVAVVERGSGLALIDVATRAQIPMGDEAKDAVYVSWRPDVATRPPYQLIFSAGGKLHKAAAFNGYLGELPGVNTASSAQSMPAWGADGRIAFVRGQMSARRAHELNGQTDVLIVPEDGGEPTPLAGASGNGLSNYYPSLSPDGRWLAVTQSALGTTYSASDAHLVLVATDGSGTVRDLPAINALGASRAYPTWSLDGRWLGFSTSLNGGRNDWDLYVAPIEPLTGLEAGPPAPLSDANDTGFEHGLTWSP